MLVVGFDTEYQQGDKSNELLCYTFHVIDTETGRECSGIHHLPEGRGQRGHRNKLNHLLSVVLIHAKKNGVFKDYPDKLSLVAHFTRADLPSFYDWPKLKSRFDGVQKTFATTLRPLRISIRTQGHRKHDVSVYLYDTMLIAPIGHKSLAALGKMLGIPKVELPSGAIENMAELRRTDPELFERYALTDAVIAARYFVTYMQFARDVLGIIDE